MTLPDIPRLYTALAEVLAVLVYAQAAPPRAAKPVTYAATAGWAAVLGVFLQLTGSVPLAWWLPCMVAAIAWLYLYLWGTREMNLLEAGYSCARAFIWRSWPPAWSGSSTAYSGRSSGLQHRFRYCCWRRSTRRFTAFCIGLSAATLRPRGLPLPRRRR